MLIPLRDADYLRIRRPGATLAIIALNVCAFLYCIALPTGERMLVAQAGGMVPNAIVHGDPNAIVPPALTVLTSMFLHGDILHLVGNLWFLWVFGQRLEQAMGSLRFSIFYLLAGLAAAATQIVADPFSTVPMIGASGAIAGVLGGYVRAFPRARIRTFVFLIIFFVWSLPAWWVLGAWFLGQFLSATSGQPGIAWFAHLGGFVFGLIFARAFIPRARTQPRAIVYHPAP